MNLLEYSRLVASAAPDIIRFFIVDFLIRIDHIYDGQVFKGLNFSRA